ncbi:MAG: hypothetical protein LBN29_06140 [Mediterranea sp.]|jgi:hypothetical protein|nr:hypothetical protein [Mediterranea sp.]
MRRFGDIHRKFHRLLAAVCASQLLYACAAVDIEPDDIAGPVSGQWIRLTAVMPGAEVGAYTRAPFAIISEDTPLKADLLMSRSPLHFAMNQLEGRSAVVFTSPSIATVNPRMEYPRPPKDVYFRTFAPDGRWTTDGPRGDTIATVGSVPGNVDLMYADVVKVSAATEKDNPSVRLAFTHALALVRVFARYKDLEARAEWGNITDMRLGGIGGGTGNVPESIVLDYTQNVVDAPPPATVHQIPLFRLDPGSFTHPYTETPFTGQTDTPASLYEAKKQLLLDAVEDKTQPIAYVMTPCPREGLGGLRIEAKSTALMKWITTQYPIEVGKIGAGKCVDIYLTLSKGGKLVADVRVDDWNAKTQYENLDFSYQGKPSVDLSAYGRANSYIVNAANANYRFDAGTQGNGLAPTGNYYTVDNKMTGARAITLWSMGGEVADTLDGVITNVRYYPDERTIYFQTANTEANGNALIALVDKSDKILWSWLIWKTDYDPYGSGDTAYDSYTITPTSGNNGNKVGQPDGVPYPLQVMKINLGAIGNDRGNSVPGALGLLYQWGRKDPFLGAIRWGWSSRFESFVSTDPAANGGWVDTNPTTTDNERTIPYGIAHPMTFITTKSMQNGDKSESWLSTPRNSLWGSENTVGNTWVNNPNLTISPDYKFGQKTCFDPCPPGWKVMPYYGYNALEKTDDTWQRGFSFSYDGASSSSPHTIWYPGVGYRYATAANITQIDKECYYWSAAGYASQNNQKMLSAAFFQNKNEGTTGMVLLGCGKGYCVRCCKE